MTHRLDALAAWVIPGLPMADIGTDHGLLPIVLLARGIIPRAIAIDLREAPLAVARKNADRHLTVEQRAALTLCQGDGLAPLVARVGTPVVSDARAHAEVAATHDAVEVAELGTIVIAGMGGARIAALLEQAGRAAHGPLARRFVLAPNDAAPRLRAALLRAHVRHERPLVLVDETMVQERGRYFPILVAEPLAGGSFAAASGFTARGEQPASAPSRHSTLPSSTAPQAATLGTSHEVVSTEDELRRALDEYLGPYLRARRDPVALAWLEWRRAHLNRAAVRAPQRKLSVAAARELAWIEALLAEASGPTPASGKAS